MIVAAFKNVAAEGIICGDIDTAFVGEDSSLNLPVSKAGAEWEGNILMHRLKCLEDKGISG